MYDLISLLLFTILLMAVSFVAPFYGPLRRKIMEIIKPKNSYDDNIVYDLFELIENGSNSMNQSISIFGLWCLFTLVLTLVASALAMIWPVLVPVFIMGFFFHRMMSKNAKAKNP